MTTVLQDLNHIQSVLFVRIDIAEYRVNEGDFPQQEIIRINDSIWDIDLVDGTYLGAGDLLNITESRSEIRSGDENVTVSLSGVPQIKVKEVLNSGIKGSEIYVYRAFYYPGTKNPILDLDNTTTGIAGRFGGFINTYSIVDTVDRDSLTSTVTINFECAGITDILKKVTRGVRTNPDDFRYIYGGQDPSMDRVPQLERASFVFGARP